MAEDSITIRTTWYLELCQRWRTIRLLLLAHNMILAHIAVKPAVCTCM